MCTLDYKTIKKFLGHIVHVRHVSHYSASALEIDQWKSMSCKLKTFGQQISVCNKWGCIHLLNLIIVSRERGRETDFVCNKWGYAISEVCNKWGFTVDRRKAAKISKDRAKWKSIRPSKRCLRLHEEMREKTNSNADIMEAYSCWSRRVLGSLGRVRIRVRLVLRDLAIQYGNQRIDVAGLHHAQFSQHTVPRYESNRPSSSRSRRASTDSSIE